jgi:hypothetical protein
MVVFPVQMAINWGANTSYAWYVGTIGHRMLKGDDEFHLGHNWKVFTCLSRSLIRMTWDTRHLDHFGIDLGYYIWKLRTPKSQGHPYSFIWDAVRSLGCSVPSSHIKYRKPTICMAVSWLYLGKPHMTNSNFIYVRSFGRQPDTSEIIFEGNLWKPTRISTMWGPQDS